MTAVAGWVTTFLFGLLLNGMPVAFALLVAGGVGLYFTGGIYPLIGVLKTAPYEHMSSYSLSTLPMFILMAEFLTVASFTRDLFDASNKWLGHIRGGLAYAAVAGGVVIAAISGSSTAAAGTLAGAAFPEMRRHGYGDSFSTGALAVIGTLAIMIPPSIGLVLYGIFTETSVGALLVAGFLPGVLTAIGYLVTIFLIVRISPKAAPQVADKLPLKERVMGLRGVWMVLVLMVFMIGGIYSGIVTPTEVGAVGALMALGLGLVMGRINRKNFLLALKTACGNSVMILTIIAFSSIFGVFLTLTGVTQELIAEIQASGVSNYVVLFAVLALLIVLGFFLDQIAILVLTLPLIFPLLTELGFDGVWLGVIFVKTAEIGLISPPMGLNVFVVASSTSVPIGKVFRGVWPFIVAEFVLLGLLIAFPQIVLFFPSLIY